MLREEYAAERNIAPQSAQRTQHSLHAMCNGILSVQVARPLPALVTLLQKALLQPSMTLAVGSCFRPMLLPLIDSVVEQALGAQNEGGASQAATSVALISLIELTPHVTRSAASSCSLLKGRVDGVRSWTQVVMVMAIVPVMAS